MTRINVSMLAVSVVLFASLLQPSTARSMLQTVGSTCSGPIPQCESGRCYLQTVAGKMQNVCERCLPGYNATADGLNCVCKPGFWHDCSSRPCVCRACDKGMFCEGGWPRAQNYASEDQKGLRLSCFKANVVAAGDTTITTATIQFSGLTTKTDRASRVQDCVPMPGFYLNTTSRTSQAAALCPASTYSIGYGRVRQCLRCQSGTEENPDSGYTNGFDVNVPPKLRINRQEVCQVPAGRYLVQNVVRDCPAGSFRTAYSMVTESNSRYCFTCPPGVTTNGTRATKVSDCNVVVAGVSLTLGDLTSAQALAATGDTSGLSNSINLCPYGTYFSGGAVDPVTNKTCVTCPFGTETQFVGATSVSDCQIPPGYYVQLNSTTAPVGGQMMACPTNLAGQGYYRSGWTLYSDVTAQDTNGTTACTPCGAGIQSALTDIDESRGGNDTARLVAGSSYSCFIQAGWGMVPTGVILADNTLQYSAVQCAVNTYGVAAITYGLQSTPCKPCQRNLVTLQAGSTNYTQCVNPAGYGYSPNGATACAPGSYAPVGSMSGCVQCPAGRTTDSNPAKQTAITDCYVIPGNGIFVGSTASPPGPWNATVTGLTDAQKAVLPVLPCPVGYWGAGGALDSKCVPCGGGNSTAGEGSSSAASCTMCAAGYGMQGGTCQLCPAGTYQPGYLGNDASGFGAGTMCLNCETTRSVYISSNGTEAEYISDGTTYRVGARGREECVPKTAQLGVDVGTKFFGDDSLLSNDTVTPGNDNATACMLKNCAAGQCCFVQFDYAYKKNNGSPGTKTCRYVNMAVNTAPVTASNLLYYKMLPSDAIAAASLKLKLKVKSMSSGLYARCDLPAAATYNSDRFGRLISSSGAGCTGCTSPADTSAGLAACKKACDMMSICWGFTVIDGQCQLRGGFDEQDVRSFFRNPQNSTGNNW